MTGMSGFESWGLANFLASDGQTQQCIAMDDTIDLQADGDWSAWRNWRKEKSRPQVLCHQYSTILIMLIHFFIFFYFFVGFIIFVFLSRPGDYTSHITCSTIIMLIHCNIYHCVIENWIKKLTVAGQHKKCITSLIITELLQK